MDTLQLPSNWPLWAIFLYLFIKDTVPVISALIERITGIVLPARAKEKELLANVNAEVENRRIDLREREVVALEQIGKNLIIIDTRLQSMDKKEDLLTVGLVTANQALAIMLDRLDRRREEYTVTKIQS